MTTQKKKIILFASLIGIIAVSILAIHINGNHSTSADAQTDSVNRSSATISSSSESGSSRTSNLQQETLLQDAQKVLHLRYDLSDTSVSNDVLKQSLRDYMTNEAVNQLFSNSDPSLQPKVQASSVPSSAAPSENSRTSSAQPSSVPSVSKPASSPSSKSASSKPAASSSQNPSSSAPDITYRPIKGCVTPRMAEYHPVIKMYSYATVKRIYTKKLASGKANVLLYYTLSVAGDSIPTNTSNRMMSLTMQDSKNVGHWIVTTVELDTKVNYSLQPFQSEK
jgi:hypothetical protein